MYFVADSHGHLSDLRIFPQADELVSEAKSQKVKYFLQGGVDPEDWVRQQELHRRHPEVLTCFGIHPMTLTQESDVDTLLDQLSRAIGAHRPSALGEIGLDGRSQFLPAKENQIAAFEAQLEIAKVADLPVVLHLVRCHSDAIRILQVCGLPKRSGFVHGFNGSWEKANDFLDLGLRLSIGGAVTHPRNRDLREAVAKIPLDRLLIESDCPDQCVLGRQDLGRPVDVLQVARVLAELRQKTIEEIVEASSRNLREVLF